ncbi:hypothetical protein ACWGVR_14095 [Streptomyces xanthophaeus]
MSHIMPASSGDTNPEIPQIRLSQFSAKDRDLLTAMFEHEGVILDTEPAEQESTPAIARLDVSEHTVRVDAWNQVHPIGTWVVAYPGARGHRQLITQTRTVAFLTSSGKSAVCLKGYASYIVLTHVDAITAARAGELLEQRHQLLDLDADSTCPLEGASYCPYLRTGGQS